MNLNPLQETAALDVDRHVLVAAGAGTGKTRCVVARLLHLLGAPIAGRQLAPDRRLALRDVAAITFTNAAAADLQRQLRKALTTAGLPGEASRVDNARIGTIHGFCGRILWEFALQIDRPPGLVALDDGEALALGSEAARDALVEALPEGDLPDLELLLGDVSVEKALDYAARLASDADRLAVIALDPDLDPRERALVALAERTLELMRRRLGQQSAVDFDAMIVLTRDLLRDRPDVRRVLQTRIRTLIVDEYQDVDPAQQEIIWLLGDPESGRADTTRLMLVGDPKQSIFRFRRSDVTIWTRVQRQFDMGIGAVHALTENRRSREAILGFVDSVIGPELDTPVGAGDRLADYEVPYQPLNVPAGAVEADLVPAVELLVLPPGDDGRARLGEDARGLEVPAVAARVRDLVEAGTAPGDIGILLPAWGPSASYQEALRAEGIRSWRLRNEGYWERREVVDCLVALRALLDPQDSLSLFGWLRGPMVGVRDETLLAIAREGKPPYWRRVEHHAGLEEELVAWAAGILRRYRALRDRMAPDDLLRGLLDETGYFVHLALLDDDGTQAEANVRKLLRLLGGWRDLTLGAILRLIDRLRSREEGAREGDAPLAARRDAVTITSIHSAKGLQWPVVIWADLTRGVVAPDYQFLIGRRTLRIRSAAAGRPDDDPRFASLRAEEAMEEQAQRKRLWYVAATRAMERLILAGVPEGELTGRHAGTPAAALRRIGRPVDGIVTYRSYRGREFRAEVRMVPGTPGGSALRSVDAPLPVLPLESLAAAREPVRVAGGRGRYSASELVTFARCPRKHWFIHDMGLREPRVKRATSEEAIDAVTRGHIVHQVLEHLRDLDGIDTLLEEAIARWDADAPPAGGDRGERYRARLREEIVRVAEHPAYRAVADRPGARTELRFVHLVEEGRVMEGVIDLAAETVTGNLVLLDVKTGPAARLSAKAVASRARGYAPQRDVYLLAGEALSGRSVERFAFHFSGSSRQVVSEVTPKVRVEAARRMKEMLEAVEAGDKRLASRPVECRFCGFKRVGWCEGVQRGVAGRPVQ